MPALDTNVLVRYVVQDDTVQLAAAKRLISRCLAEGLSIFVPVTVVLELEWVLRASFGYVKDDPVELEGTLPAGCSWELKPMMTDEELEAKRNFLAQQPVDWVNQTGEDFGSLFARPVVVTCKS